MRKFRIGEICTLEKGKQIDTSLLSDNNKYKYMNGGIAESGYYTDYNTSGAVVTVSEGGASCGFVNYLDGPFWCGCHCYRLTNIEFPPKYIYYALKANQENIMALRTGSAMPNIKKSSFAQLEINLSEVREEQEQIVHNLDYIDNLICQRQVQYEMYAQLVKSRFIEMFGEPVANTKCFEQLTMKTVCKKITDGEHGSVQRFEKGRPFLNAKHIKPDGTIDWSSVTYTTDEVHQKIYRRCNPESGDILMTTTGTIGNVAVVPESEPFSMDRGITLMKLDSERVLPVFIAWQLRFDSMQNIMKSNVHASAIGHLFLNKVEQLPIIVPEMELQEQFAAFVQATDKSKLAIQQSLDELETLKKSLMQKYFG